MNCPRCGGQVTVFELEGAASEVCEDCSYVGVLVDHRPEDADIESWDDALTRFETEIRDSVPDGVARINGDTTPPDSPVDDVTAEDSGFQFRGTPESTTIAKSGPEPGIDFPTGETQPDGLNGGNKTIVTVTDSDTDQVGNDTATQSDETRTDMGTTADATEDANSDDNGIDAAKEDASSHSAEPEESADNSATTKVGENGGNSVKENQDSSDADNNSEDKAPATEATEVEDMGTKPDNKE